MRILVINPNTTASMTDKIRETAVAVAATGTQILALSPADGPVSIEGHYDEAFCLPGLLEETRKGVADGADAVVIACFDDPGLEACREIVDVPVVGICEAAMAAASMVGHGFSVVTTLDRSVPIIEMLALKYGFERHCRRVRAASIPVLALEEEGGAAAAKVRDQVLAAIEEDRAEAVLLGCAGMTDLANALTRETGVPVIDGVAAAVKFAEALVGLGLKTCKRGAYAPPRVKPYSGGLSRHAPQDPLKAAE
ncbi:aspartate/glutamate racemase family protein [Thalassobaculum sp. OXR-137]|uniref:aspartate/glutamate racemase family protein n=1 Tax=Thalassobaculum sp. OXR-137 TaxID=3100173 RepID=UPI002AC8D605|nr:aspartate/glutamate racemase family protein [Thalassobaculum sp. OXR-137]WPZ33774.1 aspartate/glutamate racemase family protein [Thalassobaculum sp. OXR-137]